MNTNNGETITFFARTVLEDGEMSEPEQYVMVPGEPIMTMVEYQCWRTAQSLKTHPGRASVHVH